LVHSSFRAVPGADFVIPVQVSSRIVLRISNIISNRLCCCCCC
jgi:hypothetical protein